MYNHRRRHQGNNSVSSTTAFPSERHLFLRGGNIQGESGLVLSTDAKPRLKWTAELHECFIKAVNQLGGADKATPKTVMKLMGIPGLTLYHLKSHLQKYRLSKNLQSQANTGTPKNTLGCTLPTDRTHEGNSNMNNGVQPNKNIHINDAFQMQIEVQRRLHEQLEVQRHLQLRIEAQGKYLKSVLEKAHETLGKENLGSAGLEAGTGHLFELVSKVSNESFRSAFPRTEEISSLNTQQTYKDQLADFSIDSCQTSSQKDQEIHHVNIGLRTYHGNSPLNTQQMGEDINFDKSQPAWFENLNGQKTFSPSIVKDPERTVFPVRREYSILSMSITAQREKEGSGIITEARRTGREEHHYFEEPNSKRTAVKQEHGKQCNGFGMSCVTSKLDLNAHDDDAAVKNSKNFDLNGLSWS